MRSLDELGREFAVSIAAYFNGEARWAAATAKPRGGGLELWFNLPKLPSDPDFSDVWCEQLRTLGLNAQRVSNRT